MAFALTVDLVERVGSPSLQDEVIRTYVHMTEGDLHPEDNPTGYEGSEIRLRVGEAYAHSAERWIQLRFGGEWSSMTNMRFWSPELIIPDGWEVRWGTSASYLPPRVGGASSLATQPLPITEPEQNLELAEGTPPEGYVAVSRWIVLQATVFERASTGAMVPSIPYRLDYEVA